MYKMLKLVLIALFSAVVAQIGYEDQHMMPPTNPSVPEHCLPYMPAPHHDPPPEQPVHVCFDTRYFSLLPPQCESDIMQYYDSPLATLPPITLSTDPPPSPTLPPSYVPFSQRRGTHSRRDSFPTGGSRKSSNWEREFPRGGDQLGDQRRSAGGNGNGPQIGRIITEGPQLDNQRQLQERVKQKQLQMRQQRMGPIQAQQPMQMG